MRRGAAEEMKRVDMKARWWWWWWWWWLGGGVVYLSRLNGERISVHESEQSRVSLSAHTHTNTYNHQHPSMGLILCSGVGALSSSEGAVRTGIYSC